MYFTQAILGKIKKWGQHFKISEKTKKKKKSPEFA